MAQRILLLSVFWTAVLFLAIEASGGAPSPPVNETSPPANVTLPPENVTLPPENVTLPPENVTLPPANVTLPPENVTLPPANVTLPPANVTLPPANVTLPPVTVTTSVRPTTPPPNPCDSSPCGDGSSCQPGFNMTYTCLCPAGEGYNEEINRCETGKVFPGEFQTNAVYSEKMSDVTSQEFIELSGKITDSLQLMLEDIPDSKPVVLQLLPGGPVSRANERTVIAIVQIIFPAGSDATTEKVTEALKKPCDNCSVTGNFISKNLCQVGVCNPVSSSCTPGDGEFTCTCHPGYTWADDKNRLCIVQCPIGQTMKGGKCVDCDFGFTGFNCEETWERDLVIVGAVLGVLLLIAISLVIVFATKKPKKSSKKNKTPDMGKSFNSRLPANTQNRHSNGDFNHAGAGNRSANGFANTGNSDVPRIPRATTNSSWDSQTNLEMTPSHSRQNLIASTRPQNNPYAQGRPEANLYAQNQGRNNPYSM